MNDTIAIIGMGNIGGSMALGLRDSCAAIHGFDTDAAALDWAHGEGLIDTAHSQAAAAAKVCEMIVLAVPPGAVAPVCLELAPHIEPGQVVTDVSSIKGPMLEAIAQGCGVVPPWFVPGHPIAGTEKSGVRHASGTLFQGRCAVLTPLPQTNPDAVACVRLLWEQLGMATQIMEADTHDAMVAGVSHLPHVLAFALMDLLAQEFGIEELKRYAAGGLLDSTRIASSNPELWADICHGNRAQLVPMLERFQTRLSELTNALRTEQSQALHDSFSTARRTREQLRLKE